MADEIKKVELTNSTGNIRRYTVADGTAISQGVLLKLADPRTASQAITGSEMIAGIASADKEANDGATSIPAWTDGVFKAVASGAIVVGQGLMSGGGASNRLTQTDGAASGAIIVGWALDSVSDGETFHARVRL